MRFLDSLLGRSRPVPPNLDALFTLPPAAETLQAALDLHPTGVGAVCFRAAEGAESQRSVDEVLALLQLDSELTTSIVRDEYGFTWVVCRQPVPDIADLVTALHAVDSTLSDNGFGPMMLCTAVAFAAAPARRLALVYLFKRGTFYPFAPTGPQHRDTTLELQVRATLSAELRIEPELQRWFPLWNAPVP